MILKGMQATLLQILVERVNPSGTGNFDKLCFLQSKALAGEASLEQEREDIKNLD